jgi:hypothetical protein
MSTKQLPGINARLVYETDSKSFRVEGPDAAKAEGMQIIHPNGFVSNTILNGRVPAFDGWGSSIYGIQPA